MQVLLQWYRLESSLPTKMLLIWGAMLCLQRESLARVKAMTLAWIWLSGHLGYFRYGFSGYACGDNKERKCKSGKEHKNRYLTCLKFGIVNRLNKNSNSTHFIQVFKSRKKPYNLLISCRDQATQS